MAFAGGRAVLRKAQVSSDQEAQVDRSTRTSRSAGVLSEEEASGPGGGGDEGAEQTRAQVGKARRWK
eukprot:1877956-Heterocapsa_arctica.AAC.1